MKTAPGISLEGIFDQLLVLRRQEVGEYSEKVTFASSLSELGDSLDFVNLLGAIEQHFGIDISNERLSAIRTVGDLVFAIQEAYAIDTKSSVA